MAWQAAGGGPVGSGVGCALHASISGWKDSEGSCRQQLRSCREWVWGWGSVVQWLGTQGDEGSRWHAGPQDAASGGSVIQKLC